LTRFGGKDDGEGIGGKRERERERERKKSNCKPIKKGRVKFGWDRNDEREKAHSDEKVIRNGKEGEEGFCDIKSFYDDKRWERITI
jgi:hypothetical protein